MREAMHHIRAKLFTVLNGNISYNSNNVPVYNRVPTNQARPYIWMYSLSTDEIDQNSSKYCSEVVTRVECVTSMSVDAGGDLMANSIVNDCLSLLRVRSANYIDLSSSNFKVYATEIESVNYVQDDLDNSTYIKGVIEIKHKVEQTS